METRTIFIASLLFAAGVLFCAQPTKASAAPPAEGISALQSGFTAHARDLATLTDDAQALALFTSRLGVALDLKDSVMVLGGQVQASSKQAKEKAPIDVSVLATDLTKELAAWRLALGLLTAAETSPTALESFVRETEPQQTWLTSQGSRKALGEAWQLAAAMASIPNTEAGASSQNYLDYAASVDRAYPHFTGSKDSWLSVAESDGVRGVLNRLMAVGDLSEADRVELSNRYFNERLRGVLNAHLIARAIRAEAQAEQQARDQWLRLRNLGDSLREQRGLARLCGTWQWTIHNHQNHGDHKMLMMFPPPDSAPVSGLRPAKMVVAGDTVYLRWEFDRGIIQEDSLLFSGGGQRLEGTFVNSGGAWGAITAKRTAPCAKEGRQAPNGPADPPHTPLPGKSNRR